MIIGGVTWLITRRGVGSGGLGALGGIGGVGGWWIIGGVTWLKRVAAIGCVAVLAANPVATINDITIRARMKRFMVYIYCLKRGYRSVMMLRNPR